MDLGFQTSCYKYVQRTEKKNPKSKELKESMRAVSHQIENMSKEKLLKRAKQKSCS